MQSDVALLRCTAVVVPGWSLLLSTAAPVCQSLTHMCNYPACQQQPDRAHKPSRLLAAVKRTLAWKSASAGCLKNLSNLANLWASKPVHMISHNHQLWSRQSAHHPESPGMLTNMYCTMMRQQDDVNACSAVHSWDIRYPSWFACLGQ